MLRSKKNMIICCIAALMFACALAYAQEADSVEEGKDKVSLESEKIVESSQKAEKSILDKVPVAGKIIEETIDKKTDSVIWNLSNGAKVILKNFPEKKKKRKKNKYYKDHNHFAMEAFAKGGLLDVSQEDIVSEIIYSRISRILYDDQCKKWKLPRTMYHWFRLHPYHHQFFSNLSYLPGNKTDIKALFESLYMIFTDFEFKSDYKMIELFLEREKIEKQYFKYYPNRNITNYDEYVRQTDGLLKIVYNNDPYFKYCCFRDLEFSDYAKFKFNKEYFNKRIKEYLNPADYTFIISTRNVDDINRKDDIKKYVETYIASIPAGKERSVLPECRPILTNKVKYSKNYVAGHKNYRQSMYLVVRQQQHSQKNLTVMSVLEGYLESIIANKNKKSSLMKYFYADADGFFQTQIKDIMLNISFKCTGDKIDESIAAVKKELEEISAGNIRTNILNKVKKSMKKEYKKCLNNSYDFTMVCFNFLVIYNFPFSAIYEQQKMYDDVTAKDLQEMVSKALEEEISYILEYPKLEQKS